MKKALLFVLMISHLTSHCTTTVEPLDVSQSQLNDVVVISNSDQQALYTKNQEKPLTDIKLTDGELFKKLSPEEQKNYITAISHKSAIARLAATVCVGFSCMLLEQIAYDQVNYYKALLKTATADDYYYLKYVADSAYSYEVIQRVATSGKYLSIFFAGLFLNMTPDVSVWHNPKINNVPDTKQA